MTEDDQDVPLNAIRAFVTIAREKSVTRAAQAMGVTQSSVSRHLAVLEDYLGAKLMERRGRGAARHNLVHRTAHAPTQSGGRQPDRRANLTRDLCLYDADPQSSEILK